MGVRPGTVKSATSRGSLRSGAHAQGGLVSVGPDRVRAATRARRRHRGRTGRRPVDPAGRSPGPQRPRRAARVGLGRAAGRRRGGRPRRRGRRGRRLLACQVGKQPARRPPSAGTGPASRPALTPVSRRITWQSRTRHWRSCEPPRPGPRSPGSRRVPRSSALPGPPTTGRSSLTRSAR